MILKPCLILVDRAFCFLDEYVTIRFMRTPVALATQAQVERAGSVTQYANDSKSIQGACHLTTACRATHRRQRAPEV